MKKTIEGRKEEKGQRQEEVNISLETPRIITERETERQRLRFSFPLFKDDLQLNENFRPPSPPPAVCGCPGSFAGVPEPAYC